jgi:hypothetical protein
MWRRRRERDDEPVPALDDTHNVGEVPLVDDEEIEEPHVVVLILMVHMPGL